MAITYGDLTNPDKKQRNQDLFGKFGMDAGGDNEIGAWLRRLAQSSGERAAMGSAYQTGLEQDRQGAISGIVANSNPYNAVSQAQAQGSNLYNLLNTLGNRQAANLQFQGYGQGAQLGARTEAANKGMEGANQLLMNAYDPANQNQLLIQALQAIGQAGGTGLQELLSMFGAIENRSQQNKADKQAGSGLGQIGSILGMLGGGGFGNLFGQGGGTFTPQTPGARAPGTY